MEPGNYSDILVKSQSEEELNGDLSGVDPLFFICDTEEQTLIYNEDDQQLDLLIKEDFEKDDAVSGNWNALKILEVVGKSVAVSAFTYYMGGSMVALYAAGLATTALATAVHKLYESDQADLIANSILKVELGVLKNFAMKLMWEQVSNNKSGIAYDGVKWIFGEYLNNNLIQTFGMPIVLNLVVSYMAEAFGDVQNKLFLEDYTDGKVKQETDPFLTYRAPHTIVKRTMKNYFGVFLPDNFDVLKNYKTMMSLAGHYFANVPIALYYNMDKKLATAEKTFVTSVSKTYAESFTQKAIEYSEVLPKKSLWSRFISTVVGTTSYVTSKLLTRTK